MSDHRCDCEVCTDDLADDGLGVFRGMKNALMIVMWFILIGDAAYHAIHWWSTR